MFARWNKYLVTLLLLVYTSQSIAALLMPCQMDAAAGEAGAFMPAAMPSAQGTGHAAQFRAYKHATLDHSALDHSAMHAAHSMAGGTDPALGGKAGSSEATPLGATSPASHDASDCCGLMGHCPQGNCTLPGASADPVQVAGTGAVAMPQFRPLHCPSQFSSAHFRPPISV